MAVKLDDAIDVRVIAHINGVGEVMRLATAARRAVESLDEAIKELSVELEVD